MQRTKFLCLGVLMLVLLTCGLPAAAAESYWECTATGVEKNGDRKADVNFRLDGSGNVISGQIKFAKVCKDKTGAAGGEYTYAGGARMNRDVGQYEWVLEANWTGTNETCGGQTAKNQGTVLVRKFKIQNVAEMRLKGKDGTVWFIFPHGWEYKQVSVEEKAAEPAR